MVKHGGCKKCGSKEEEIGDKYGSTLCNKRREVEEQNGRVVKVKN